MKGSSQLTVKNMRLSVRFQHVIFPLDMEPFARALVKNGFALREPFPPASPSRVDRFAYTGPMALRDDIVVDINYQMQFVGITSKNWESIAKAFDDVMGMLEDDNSLGGPFKKWFYEFEGHFEYRPTDENPLKILSSASSGLKCIQECEGVVGTKCALRSIRIGPANTAPDSSDFFEVIIEPTMGRPHSSFEILIIYRNEKSELVNEFAERVDKTIQTLMRSMQ